MMHNGKQEAELLLRYFCSFHLFRTSDIFAVTRMFSYIIEIVSVLSTAIPDVEILGVKSLRGYGRCGGKKVVKWGS